MTGLKIVRLQGSEIQWIYRGQPGVSAVSPWNVVQVAILTDEDFSITNQPVRAKIIKACQQWLDALDPHFVPGCPEQVADRLDRVRPFHIRVSSDESCPPRNYTVLTTSEIDARVLAFALDGGFGAYDDPMDQGHIGLALTYTEVVK
jgi:hypothetical protein